MIQQALAAIGLTRGESEVYEVLVELGQSKAGDIVRHANLASSRVYIVLDRLIEKGLASFVLKNGVKYFDATPPERLLDFLETKKEEIMQAQEDIREIIPVINARREQIDPDDKVVVYKGKEGPRIVLKESIEAGKRGEPLWGFGTDEDPYKDYLPADITQHMRDQQKHHISWRLLFTQGEWKPPNPLDEVRYLPPGFTLPIRTMIYGEKVAIVDFTQPITTIIIRAGKIVDNYKQLFTFLWDLAEPARDLQESKSK